MRGLVARRIFLLVLGAILLSGPAAAQQTGTLSGTVRDAQGGILPGVTINVSSPALIGGARATTTGGAGTYQLTGLPPGTYDVAYELSGFSTLKRGDIRVLVAQITRLDVELGVGSLQETVVVTAHRRSSTLARRRRKRTSRRKCSTRFRPVATPG